MSFLTQEAEERGGFQTDHILQSNINDLHEFVKWSGFKGTELEKGISFAKRKIRIDILNLADFVREEFANNYSLSKIIGSLRVTSVPVVNHFIDTLTQTPPTSIESARYCT
ncbi:MAG: hypothetical protein AAGB46_02595 [Verrucomicrobiota bacterium]